MKISMKHLQMCLLAIVLSFVTALGLQAQTGTVSGVVSDAKTNEPVVGAALMVKGTTRGVSSNADGSYSLRASKGEVIVCQFFGYKTVEITVGASTKIDFALEEDTQTLDQSVVVGYGTLKKTQLVGSVENLDGERIADRPNVNIARSLQGQIAGLNIIQTDGKASHSGNIYIRTNTHKYTTRASMTNGAGGSYSIGSGGGALVLIDGVEGDLSQVNTSDVETVAVLKDASSASIYGAKAYNGVILVTTKQAQADKFSVSYNGAYSLNDRSIKWEDNIISDGLEWTKAFYDFFAGDSVTPNSSGKVPSTINTFNSGADYLQRLQARREAGNTDVYDLYNNAYAYYGSTNWLEEFYKRQTSATTHDISVRGSSKKINYSLTGRFFTQEGLYKIGDDEFSQYNLRSKVKLNITDWLSVDNNTSLYRSKQKQSMFTTGSVLGKQIDQHGQPVFVPYNENGTYTLAAAKTGFASFIDGNTGQTDSGLNIVTTTGLNIDILKDVLKFRGDFSYKAIRKWKERYRAPLTFWLSDNSSTEYVPQASSYKSRWSYDTDYLTANAYFTFTPKLGENHDLNVVAGWNLEDYKYDRFYVQRKGMLFPDKYQSFELFDGIESTSFTQDDSNYGTVGFFGRINYTFLRRYIVELAGRYDGSSKFPSASRWGFFPSASLGWRLSEEPWMKWSKSWLDNFKLRANAGSLGNGSIGSYSFLETMGLSKSGLLFDGSYVNCTSIPSPIPTSLTWETVTTYDIGIDADFLRSRLSFSGDIYLKDTKDVITAGPQLPDVYGASSPSGNYARFQDKGWEFTLSWRDAFNVGGKDLTYGIKASVWDTRTWVKDYTSLDGNILRLYPGKELGEIWGFRTDGIFRDNQEALSWSKDSFHKNGSNFVEYAGDLKFIDIDGDGDINYGKGTLDDHGDLERIGNQAPRYQFGLNLDFNWNGIGLSMFFQGVGHRDWYPDTETGFFWGSYNRPYSPYLQKSHTTDYAVVDYSSSNWVVTNYDDNPYWTRRVAYASNRNVGPLSWENDHYLQNAAYIRLKNLTIDYTLPKKVVNKVHIQNVKFYVTMENLFTWSPMFKHTKMFDPEVIGVGDTDFDSGSVSADNAGLSGVGEGYSYPMFRTFTFGVNITL